MPDEDAQAANRQVPAPEITYIDSVEPGEVGLDLVAVIGNETEDLG